jgi:hypothetical protein
MGNPLGITGVAIISVFYNTAIAILGGTRSLLVKCTEYLLGQK